MFQISKNRFYFKKSADSRRPYDFRSAGILLVLGQILGQGSKPASEFAPSINKEKASEYRGVLCSLFGEGKQKTLLGMSVGAIRLIFHSAATVGAQQPAGGPIRRRPGDPWGTAPDGPSAYGPR